MQDELSKEMHEHQRKWIIKQMQNTYDHNALVLTSLNLMELLRNGNIKDKDYIDRMEILIEIYEGRKGEIEC